MDWGTWTGTSFGAIIAFMVVSVGWMGGACVEASPPESGPENALEAYLARPEPAFTWSVAEESVDRDKPIDTYNLRLTSQTWRSHRWKHDVIVVRPRALDRTKTAFLWITGNELSSEERELLKTVALKGNAIAAALTDVPNQPLFDGLVEDGLIAHTFAQFMKTGDPTWPLLFPMTKAASRGMDAVQAFASERFDIAPEQFVVGGASKRGWTTYLTAAVDDRVAAMAPLVFEMVNMPAQTEWADKTLGGQSEMIRDYTERGLVKHMEHPRLVKLRHWVDPYHYASRYTMPKLLMLGTNDPYWVVDSAQHYWKVLPKPKWMRQIPNAKHHLLKKEHARATLAAWFKGVIEGAPLPQLDGTVSQKADHPTQLELNARPEPDEVILWTARSPDRDFRDAGWESEAVQAAPSSDRTLSIAIPPPASGFKAFFAELHFRADTDNTHVFTTEVFVLP